MIPNSAHISRTSPPGNPPTFSKACTFGWRQEGMKSRIPTSLYTRALGRHITHSPSNPPQRTNLHLSCSQQFLQAASSRTQACFYRLLLVCEVVIRSLGELSLGAMGNGCSWHTESRARDKFVRRPGQTLLTRGTSSGRMAQRRSGTARDGAATVAKCRAAFRIEGIT